MKITDLQDIKINNRLVYIRAFKEIMDKIRTDQFNYEDGENEKYFVINEERLNSHFVHIVPKELINVFNKVRKDNPSEFLGFSVLVRELKDKEVRLSCFGIPCAELTKTLIN